MSYLALDLSKRSTGWALWKEGWDTARIGHWKLGSEYSSDGQVYGKLHRSLNDLFKLERFEFVFIEEPINLHKTGGTSANNIRMSLGLNAHVESFAVARRCRRLQEVNVSSWRQDFIGRDITGSARKEAKRAGKSARDQLKRLTIARCRQLGFTVSVDDEADAIGILTYGLSISGITPPWLANETLRPILDVGTAR